MKRFFRKLFKPLLVVVCVLTVLTVIATNTIDSNEETSNKEKITVDQNGKVIGESQGEKQKNSPLPTDSKSNLDNEKPSASPLPTATPVEDKKITLMAVGDDLVHDSIIDSGKRSDGTYNYDHLFTNILEDIKKADVSVINQETVLGGKELRYSGYPRFNSPQEIGDAIVKAGFNVVLDATNHAMDKGEKGMQNSIDYWKKHKGVTVVGVNETEKESNDVKVIEVKGIKLALLNYTYSLNGLPLPSNRPYMVNMLDEEKIRKDVALAKEKADFVIVFPHWGTEYSYDVSSAQKRWTKIFLETGVDLVIGAHPHVIEPIEWLEGEDGHKMLIYYSLGNYVSGQDEYPRMLGGMANITIECKNGEKPYISDASITPIVTQFGSDYENLQVLRLSDYTDQLASVHRIRGMSVSKLKNLAKQVWGDWYKEN